MEHATSEPFRPPTLVDGGRPLSRKRAETRARLLEAALDVFAEVGVGAATVEQLCERAGFTRGAFYSNYATKEDLLLGLHTRRSEQLLAALAAVVGAHERAADAVPDSPAEVVAEVLAAVPQDRRWWLVNTEFVLHGVRDPAFGDALVAQRAAVRDGVERILRATLEQLGLTTTVPAAEVVRWLVALHEGGLHQAYLEPDVVAPGELATRAASHLFAAVTTPATAP